MPGVPGLPGQRPRKVSKLSAPALVLGAATLMLGAGVAAQDAVTTFRQRPETARSQPLVTPADPESPAALGIRGSTTTPERAGQARPSRAAQRAATRRFRQITAQPVRREVRPPAVPPDVAREVQPIFGRDPAPPLRRASRREVAREVQPAFASGPAPPWQRPPRRAADADPYASIGYRVGAVSLFPSIEQAVGYDTNPNRVSGDKKGSVLLRTEGELRVQSDWSRHELTGLLRGAYNDYPNVKGADRPEGSGRLNLRLDASRDTRIDLETRYTVDTLRPGSPEFPGSPDLDASVTERPLVATAGASAGVTHQLGRASLGLRGSIDRTAHEDARLAGGTILDQSDRDRTQYEGRLRLGYELKPGFVPFVEGIADARVYDRRFDFDGFQRSSQGFGGRAGSTFELTRLVTGEASAGYMVRMLEDPRLRDFQGPLLDGSVIWSATPLTTVRLRGSTQLAETTIEEASGALVGRATLEVQHDLRRNISLIGSATFWQTDYRGIDLREEGFAGTARVDYRLTRSVALRASFTHERLKSSEPGSDYTANVYLVGLRFQP
jgi:hypothetical protein